MENIKIIHSFNPYYLCMFFVTKFLFFMSVQLLKPATNTSSFTSKVNEKFDLDKSLNAGELKV